MKPLIISLSPFRYPNGGALWSCHLSKLCGTNVCAPVTDLSNIHDIYGDYCLTDEIESGDYTIIGGPPFPYEESVIDILKQAPRPIFMMLHDIMDMAEKCRPFWEEHIDFIDAFIVSNDETFAQRPAYIPPRRCVRLRLPYSPVWSRLDLDGRNNKRICTLGRITPDKGARQVAMLTDYGFEVYVMGQKVDLEEYYEYYKRVEATGAIMVPNPTDEQKREVLRKCTFYCSFTYQVEREVIVEYSVLEAMNHGCYPVVANWMQKYFELGGLHFTGVENTQNAAYELKKIINFNEKNKELFDAKVISNYNNVLHWFDMEFLKLEDEVTSIKRFRRESGL